MTSSVRYVQDQMAREREEALRNVAIRAALAKIVAEADRNPFNPIGHVIEHVVPEARAALDGPA